MAVPAPTCWLLARFGASVERTPCNHFRLGLGTGNGLDSTPTGLGARDRERTATAVKVPGGWAAPRGDCQSLWPAAFAACEAADVMPDVRRTCYEDAAQRDKVPRRVRANAELILIDQCFVTTSDTLARQVQRASLPVIVLGADAVEAWTAHGALNLSGRARIEHDGLAEEPSSLLDVVPEIAQVIADDFRDIAWVYACQNLRMQIDEVRDSLAATYTDRKFLVDLEQLGGMAWQDHLTILVHEAGNAGWLIGKPGDIANDIVQNNLIRRRAKVASRLNLAERLLCAVGGSRDALLSTFDDAVRRAIELKGGMNPLDLSYLALAVHWAYVLTALQERLESEGLQPPRRWGTQESLDFAPVPWISSRVRC